MAVRESWEQHLIELAERGLETDESFDGPRPPDDAFNRALNHCNRLTHRHSRTFHLASALLPREKRWGARALYAFCRITDDTVDQAKTDPAGTLETWRRRVLDGRERDDDPVVLAWCHARSVFRIPRIYMEQLIDGVGLDLTQHRYETFEDLAVYCYGVASTVGLMSMHIIGYSGPEAVPYAVKMGVALQITNILRDVGEDWARGRLYIPKEDLSIFGVTEDQIAEGRVDENWRRLMQFQVERVRKLYDESWPGVAMLNRDGQFAIAAAADLYRGILRSIEANDYDNFRRRAYLSMGGKLVKLPGIWRRLQRLRRTGAPAK